MATPFSDVYDMFLSNISDYTFLEFDPDNRESIMHGYLVKAIVEFKSCVTSLARTDSTEYFTLTLSEEIQSILASYMVRFWIRPQILNINILTQQVSSKDFKLTSQANHLDVLLKLKKEWDREIDRLTNRYNNYAYSLEDLD